MTIAIEPIAHFSFDEWLPLAQGYKAFYKAPLDLTEYRLAWNRLEARHVQGLGARVDGALVGIAHYLWHASTWADRVCYLQDLYVLEAARGKGVARALIDKVADEAKNLGCARYYWLTQDHNELARALYDRVGEHKGFIRYDYRW